VIDDDCWYCKSRWCRSGQPSTQYGSGAPDSLPVLVLSLLGGYLCGYNRSASKTSLVSSSGLCRFHGILGFNFDVEVFSSATLVNVQTLAYQGRRADRDNHGEPHTIELKALNIFQRSTDSRTVNRVVALYHQPNLTS
jgi:hypothetical protein